MKMRENMQDVFRVFSNDEQLLRLLYYLPSTALDNPLDTNKPNILTMPEKEKWEIINDRIKTIPKVDDLDLKPVCRLLFFPGDRGNTNSYLVADQQIVIDIMVHFAYEDVDQRLEWLCDRINELLFDKNRTGMGKTLFEYGRVINAPQGYVGYKLVYSFGSGNK
jgi:hypothetical protein